MAKIELVWLSAIWEGKQRRKEQRKLVKHKENKKRRNIVNENKQKRMCSGDRIDSGFANADFFLFPSLAKK